jgi:hypothetical protein
MSTEMTIHVGDEQIVLDGSFFDFSDFTPTELEVVAKSRIAPLIAGEEPSAGAVASMVAIKLARGRSWDTDTLGEVILLLTAWLTDNLEEVSDA